MKSVVYKRTNSSKHSPHARIIVTRRRDGRYEAVICERCSVKRVFADTPEEAQGAIDKWLGKI
jgi:hypothetical protein